MRKTRGLNVPRVVGCAACAALIATVANYLLLPRGPRCDNTRGARCFTNLKDLVVALHAYQADYGDFPYLERLSVDSWGWQDPLIPLRGGGPHRSECPVRTGLPTEATGYGITGRIRGAQWRDDPEVPLVADSATAVFESWEFPQCVSARAVHPWWEGSRGGRSGLGANVCYGDGHCRWVPVRQLGGLKY